MLLDCDACKVITVACKPLQATAAWLRRTIRFARMRILAGGSRDHEPGDVPARQWTLSPGTCATWSLPSALMTADMG